MPEWATYVADRSPKFKVHTTRGFANAAISNHWPSTPVELYHLESGGWVLKESYPVPTNCAECDIKITRKRVQYGTKGPKFKRPIVCGECWDKAYHAELDRRREQAEREELERLQQKYGK